MSSVDQFESAFRSAVKDVFVYDRVQIASILLVTDLSADGAAALGEKLKEFIRVMGSPEPSWKIVEGDAFATTEDLQNLVKKEAPDLICAYRNLHSRAWRFPHSLGEHLDVLLQKTDIPVLVIPHPNAGYAYEHALEDTDAVMAVTDHLTNDGRLVNYACRFVEDKGELFLVHIEDDAYFERYMGAIEKISTVDTETARTGIRAQLLKEPMDYADSCRKSLKQERPGITVEHVVRFGHYIRDYRSLIEEHKVDLLVMNTKDDDQLAMHGLAYPLAVELRELPILML